MDLASGNAGDWLVIGWFTPDYRTIAARFADNLRERGAPYHLFAQPVMPDGAWSTLRKPAVVLQAMAAYPDKTLILMDVDCVVTGDLAPLAAMPGPVGLSVKMRERPRTRRWQREISVSVGSRVAVFKAAALVARDFATEWQHQCERSDHPGGDETALTWAYLLRPDIEFSHIDGRYVGRELGARCDDPQVAVWHDSVHDKKGLGRRLQLAAKRVERIFRAGRTNAKLTRKLPRAA
jgi:hypothetical protein